MKTRIHITLEDTGFNVKAICEVKIEDAMPVAVSSIHRTQREALNWATNFAGAEIEDAA